jgi:hypothetical protein
MIWWPPDCYFPLRLALVMISWPNDRYNDLAAIRPLHHP